ncbi:stage V sporulation protein AC [Sporolactobacillus inulinus]|jgi:stage V sporulation protein AC|uniref:Stage V sporulation protein AC n=2 Tax=Sporolactobacillus inulinus TaxID=2078 RepID=A0A4Y3T6K7_9BACL|nr:stage V sporulation protein AC [Sporolactobacillus inulinus]KLI03027.1 stage V sporulation protein AC [Sporolactobacillus inulinus CASD]GAY78448.1 stage V sporulation protein AC [Sporolactobacillus inulinus]GEB77123.1 stage V sporulation protein AC [Sporolactobacillus inulinus]
MLNDPKNYKENVKAYQPKVPYFMNCFKAFLVGGLISLIGQGVQTFYMHVFHFSKQTAGNPTVATLILASALLTGFGIYDKIANFAGAGTIVPVTGFANSITSSALEHKNEGVVLGIATNLFQLAGEVIVFGVVSAAVLGIVRLFIEHLF